VNNNKWAESALRNMFDPTCRKAVSQYNTCTAIYIENVCVCVCVCVCVDENMLSSMAAH